MHSPRFARLFTTTVAFLIPLAAPAADVLFVDNETPNPSWQELIESDGHTFTLFDTATYNLSLNNQDSIDYVNSFDVIVISGSNPAFNALRAHGVAWNTQPTPMINMGNFLISGQFQAASWRWTSPANGGAVNSSGVVDVLDENDPIWTGVSLTPDAPPTIDLFSANAGHLTLGTNTFLPDITTVAAQSSSNATIAIAYAAPEALREGGGHQYFIAGMTGGTNNPVSYHDDGNQVFLNVIAALTGGLPQDDRFQVTISPNGADYDFEWESQPGKLYDLLTSTDLATPVSDWPVYDDGVTLYQAIPSAGETTTLTAVSSADPRRFFAMSEYDAPPPPPLFFADFKEGDGGFTVATAEGTAWAWGKPASTGPGGTIGAGNDGSDNCWGTGIGNPGFYVVPTSTTLSSPVINLTEVTGAALGFYEALDLEANDSAQVFLVNADTGADIGGPIYTAADADLSNANWAEVGPIDISAGAGLNVRLEWRFSGLAASADYMGWYIDDVRIDETTAP